jgi:acyl-CoA synthetase (AMP-forming)/AMP-acid ligase II
MKIYNSPYADAHIPVTSFTEFVLQKAVLQPDKPALIDGPSGRTLTYAQLVGAIHKVAASLHRKGFAKGDVFCIYSPNIPEYAIIFHAVASLGGIVTTANPLYTAEELAYQCNDSKARFIITVGMFLEKAQVAQKDCQVEEIFTFDGAEGSTPFVTLLQSDGVYPKPSLNPQEDLIVLPYSSGTTGYPKGVMLTHYNLVANICQMEGIIDFGAEDTMIGILPFFHIYGMVVVMGFMLYTGGSVVSLPMFELELFLRTLQDYKITRAALVPPIILALAKHPSVDHYDLSALKQIFSGAAPLDANLQQAVQARLKDCLTVQGYGLTETSPVTHATENRPERVKAGSVGCSIRSTQVRVVHPESGQDLEANRDGEIWIKGPQVMRGYLNNPEATRLTIDDEGWLHTGDIGHVDEEGFLFIVDRLKELIKYKGFQVAPAVLEGLLLRHPAVADAAVIGVPDEEAGELPKGFVVLKPGQSADPDEIMHSVAEHVSPQEKLRLIEFVEAIPKSASGKILRRVLRDREKARSS